MYLPVVHTQHDVGVSHASGYCHTDDTVSRNRKRRAGGESDLNSGLCESLSLSVGIRLFNCGHRMVY